jgi:hypothetical protein
MHEALVSQILERTPRDLNYNSNRYRERGEELMNGQRVEAINDRSIPLNVACFIGTIAFLGLSSFLIIFTLPLLIIFLTGIVKSDKTSRRAKSAGASCVYAIVFQIVFYIGMVIVSGGM